MSELKIRTTPFKQLPPPGEQKETPAQQTAGTNQPAANTDYRVNLADRLKVKFRTAVEAEQEAERAEQETEQAEQSAKTTENKGENAGTEGPKAPGAATFEDFEAGVKNHLTDNLDNPEEIAKFLIEIGNVGRVSFGPGLYESIMYPGNERNDLRGVVAKAIENEKKNLAPDHEFNNYEKRLYSKWPKLQEAISNISYTKDEIDMFARILARDIKDTGVVRWLDKYRWLLCFIYLEVSHARNIIGTRGTELFFSKYAA